jgi:membrane protease YdiL (CAAX protease family)
VSSNIEVPGSARFTSRPLATACGLAIALLGAPTFVALYRLMTGENHSDVQIVVRNSGLFLLAGFLLWLVRTQEDLPLTSIGLHVDRVRRSLLRGSLLAVAALVLTVGLYLLLQQFGVHLGGGTESFHPSLWVVTLTMLRAGVVEEIFYRGYAIERLEAMTRSKWLAGLAPLVLFAAAHYSQGVGGILAAFVLGGMFTVYYMRFRDLIANITGHFLADFVLNVGLPLLAGG